MLLPLALSVLLLHVREVARTGLAQPPVYAVSGMHTADYPTVGGTTAEVSGAHDLESGDRLIRVGEIDLAGKGYLGFMGAAFSAAGDSLSATLTFERAGRQQITELRLVPYSVPWLRIPFLATMLLLVTLLLFQRPNDPFVRLSTITFAAVVFGESIFEGGGEKQVLVAKTIFILGGALWWPMSLYFLTALPDGRRLPKLQTALPALSILVALLWTAPKLLYVFGSGPFPSEFIPALVSGADAITITIPAALFAITYRSFGSSERHQMRGFVYTSWTAGIVMFATLAIPLVAPGFSGFPQMLALAGLTAAIIPVGFAVAILEFRLFELDRLIGQTASLSVLAALLLGALFTVIPPLSETFAREFAVDPASGRLVLSMLLAGLAIPTYRWLEPQVTARFFPERERLEQGMQRLIEEQALRGDARSVATHMADQLHAIMRPTFCAAYLLDADSGGYVLTDQPGDTRSFPATDRAGTQGASDFPKEIGRDDPLLLRLKTRGGELIFQPEPSVLARRATDSAFFTERVEAALVLPPGEEILDGDALSRIPQPVGLVITGRKQSGDGFSTAELSLLTAVLLSTSRHLRLLRQTADLDRERDRSEALESAHLARSHYLASASHDLRQPLHALQLFSEALLERVTGEEERAISQRIRTSAAALQEMFDSLIDLSRIDQNQLVPNRSSFRVRPLIERLADEAHAFADAKGLRLEVSAADVRVDSDPVLLGRMVQNLITNALRYTPSGFVAIRAEEEAGSLRILVEDSGSGIPTDRQEMIFEEFVRLEESNAYRGLGLGLSIVRRLSQLLDHPVSLQSEVGHGSTFSLRVPIAATTAQAVSLRDATVFTDRPILIIDDDLDILLGTRALLEGWGAEARVASNREEAIAAIASSDSSLNPIELLLVDFRLVPPEDGLSLIVALRSHFERDIPAIIVSGTQSEELSRRVAEAGLTLLPKPLAPARLRAAISQVFATLGN